jgi:cell division protein FtsN
MNCEALLEKLQQIQSNSKTTKTEEFRMSTLRKLILVSLMVLFLCPFASNAQTDEESMLEQARHHFSAGNYYFATTWLERILKENPATPQREEILLLMSKAYASTGRDEKAAQSVLTLLKDYPKAAASLDPELLKLAGYGHPPESASPAAAVPIAPAEPEKNTAASAPAASVPTVAKVPEPEEPPLVPSPPPVAVPPSAPTEPTVKTVSPTPTVEPAARNAENPKLAGMLDNAAKTVTYTLKIGEYVVKSAMADAKRKIKKTGLSPVVEQGPKRNKPMIRLYFGEFSNQATARREQNKLRAAKADSFFLMDGDRRFHVYAGSYIDQKGAEKEQQRLASLGIKLSLKQVVVPVPTFLLTVGSFPTREAALEKAVELEKQGVKAVVIQRSMVRKLP